jgi:Domain of unknown function (DUF4345)
VSAPERRALQIAVALGSVIPISAGAVGVLLGPAMVAAGPAAASDLDSHFRYLSGLLLAIGFGFASTIPRIEARGGRFQLLTSLVIAGGIGRLVSLLTIGAPSPVMIAALVMELLVTPGLAVWQYRIAGTASRSVSGLAPRARTPSGATP